MKKYRFRAGVQNHGSEAEDVYKRTDTPVSQMILSDLMTDDLPLTRTLCKHFWEETQVKVHGTDSLLGSKGLPRQHSLPSTAARAPFLGRKMRDFDRGKKNAN